MQIRILGKMRPRKEAMCTYYQAHAVNMSRGSLIAVRNLLKYVCGKRRGGVEQCGGRRRGAHVLYDNPAQ